MSSATLPAPMTNVQPWVSPRSPSSDQSLLKNLPEPSSTPKILGSCPTATVSPRPNRKPVMTGFETRSITPPSRSSPAPTRTAAETTARPADSAANLVASPSARGPTATAERAEVAVVALTTSVLDVPSSA
jgi:hypothetical protein